MERLYALAAGRDYLDPKTRHVEMTADAVIRGLKKFHVIPHTQAEYAAMTPKEKAVLKKESGFLIGGNFGGFKTKADCKYRSIVTLDLDALTPETAAQSIDCLRELHTRGVIYSTASHRPEKPRLRAFIFLDTDVSPDDYVRLVKAFALMLPPGVISSETYKPSQLMYRPQRCSDGEEVFIELEGTPLLPLPLLTALPPDTTPERKSEATPAWEKPGIVGAVARLYEGDFDRAIAELALPYERSKAGPTCAPGEDRYTYTKGSGADGAIWYAGDGHLYSHHGTDPCREQNCTIFDVWRLHNAHPEQDDPAAPLHARASHRTAQEWFVGRFPQLSSEVRAEPTADELEDLGPLPDELEPSGDEPEKPLKFRVVPAGEFSAGPPPAWWIKGVLPHAEIAMMYGASGSGKSFLAWDMACAIQRGEAWRARKVRQGRVVYLCAEGMGGFRTRIQAYAAEKQAPMTALPGVIPHAPNLLEVEDVKELIRALKAYGDVDLIVIDTFSATTPGSDENTSKDIGRALAHLKAIHRITGAMVLAVHHSGKDAARGARGWSGLRAAVDAEMEVSRQGDTRLLTLTKSKDGRDGLFWGFGLKTVRLGLDSDGDEVTSCVVEPIEVETAQSSKPALTKVERQVFDAISAHLAGRSMDGEEVLDHLLTCNIYGGTEKSQRGSYGRTIKRLTEKEHLYWHHSGTQLSERPPAVIELPESDDE